MDTRAWVLNFDAEYELSLGSGYTPTRVMRERSVALRSRVQGLVPDTCLIIDESTPLGAARGRQGVAWCPTPRALRLLAQAGAIVPDAPPVHVLRAANHRLFATTLGPTLPGAIFTADETAIERAVGGPSPTEYWLLKRPLELSGRGRLRVPRGKVGDRERLWIRASLRQGDGLQVEPWVERRGDFALHVMLARDGTTRVGDVTVMVVEPSGAWSRSEPMSQDALSHEENLLLHTTAARAATALHELGYFGPFNLDAFHYRDQDGITQFHPLCEINARYSMGFAVGFASMPGALLR